MRRQVGRITLTGIVLAGVAGLICVWPTVYIDLLKQGYPWPVHYGWAVGATLVSIVIELYLLILIAVHAVHRISELINIHGHRKSLYEGGPFAITPMLARAAMQLPDPMVHILGIDPFEQISKRNLIILGILYKLRITLTNLIAKFILRNLFGMEIHGISVNYIALPVECFWNALFVLEIVKQARLRLFGFSLSNHIADDLLDEGLLGRLSTEARKGCLRAIGNAVVMARNYHPNMIILLLRFQELLNITEEDRYDDWDLFMQTLDGLDPAERAFLLNLFTMAASFDGRLHRREFGRLTKAYGKQGADFFPRLRKLTEHLRQGRLHAAVSLCDVDYRPPT